jgi:protein-tyrosine-phosphatase
MASGMMRSLADIAARVRAAAQIRFRSVWAVATARRATFSRLKRGGARRILVVCYGNIYRSAFLGAYLRQSLAGDFQVRSVGFHPAGNRPCPARHIAMAGSLGVPLEGHRSAVISAADVDWADMIALMDVGNWAALERLGADSGKYVWVGALTKGSVEIPDPYKLSDAEAAVVLGRLAEAGRLLSERVSAQ